MDIFRDLYQQLIIDHNQNPRNFYEITDASHHADGQNPLCGDELSIFINEFPISLIFIVLNEPIFMLLTLSVIRFSLYFGKITGIAGSPNK